MLFAQSSRAPLQSSARIPTNPALDATFRPVVLATSSDAAKIRAISPTIVPIPPSVSWLPLRGRPLGAAAAVASEAWLLASLREVFHQIRSDRRLLPENWSELGRLTLEAVSVVSMNERCCSDGCAMSRSWLSLPWLSSERGRVRKCLEVPAQAPWYLMMNATPASVGTCQNSSFQL